MLENKVIIVTGGSGLLGKAMIDDITQKGGIAINADINIETDLEKRNIQLNILDTESIDATLAEIEKHFGKIDGIVNNAYPRTKDWGAFFEDIPYDSWKKNVDMQMNAVFYICQKSVPYLEKSKGSLVNISSIYGLVGPDFTVYDNTSMTMPAAYSAIKGGIVNFSRYLSSYLGRKGIRVNVVSPGGIFDHQKEEFVNQYNKKVPMGRMGLPKDIAPSVSFLLSDDAGYITGQNLVVDGGWTAI
ncbi:MAG: oxidoreductase [Flavobacteriales bacterium]|nr:oxidoreductase [Flavobacteriales bacterium]